MHLRLSYRRPAGLVDIAVTLDAGVAVGALAAALLDADPAGAAAVERPTVTVFDSAGRGRTLPPDTPITESGVRAGAVVEVTRAPSLGGPSDRGPAVAVIRVVAGPDKGREFPVPAGTSVIGREAGVDIRLSDPLVSKRHARVIVGGQVELVDLASANGVVVGGRTLPRVVLGRADSAVLGDTEIVVTPLVDVSSDTDDLAPVVAFTRSPRVVVRYPERTVPAPRPPAPPQRQRFPLLALVAPLVMGVVLWFATQQLLSLVFVALSPLIAIGTWVDHTVTSRRALRADLLRFEGAVDAARADVEQEHRVERAVRLAEHLSTRGACAAITTRNPDLWGTRPEHDGFLALRVGVGTAPSRLRVELPSDTGTEPEHRARLRDLALAAGTIDGVPVVVRLRSSGSLGISGPDAPRGDLARSLVLQLCGTHAPSELTLACFASPTSRSQWAWLVWMPHQAGPHSPLSGEHLADNPGAAASLLARLEELVESRGAGVASPRGPVDPARADEVDEPVLPAVVVVVEGDAAVDRARLTRLAERGADVGVHLVWTADTVAGLPATARSFISIGEPGSPATVGQVRLGEHTHPVTFETVDAATAHVLARQLAPVVDQGAPVDDDSDLPRSVSYVDLAGRGLLSRHEDVLDRWRENESIIARDGSAPVRRKKAAPLRAVIGSTGTEPFSLDLRSQGPHALVGGTTGSGKSEFLQSWVLGLATAYSPDRVTFLFVDYKGGTAFADCVALPHTVGLVTDLSPHLVRRALTSLRAELHHRERLLNRKRAKDLVAMELVGDPEAPPSLVIVIDEFAALANEVPEFVGGVIDVAARGRSLGLHLILATQRPGGVITGSLRTNTNLRVALRMADGEDSTDILGVPTAAEFDPAIQGRGAARTGPGRIAGFQTGYAGGRTTETPPAPRIDIAELAFGSGSSWVAPEPLDREVADPGPTDIARIVSTVQRAAADAGVLPPRRPWLEELAPVYEFSRLPQPRTDDMLLLGVRDDPATQTQPIEFYRPDRDGNMAILGTGGTGKSTALRAIAVAAAVTPRGGPVHVYGLDFGSGALRLLEPLPHVAAIVQGDDDERVRRVVRRLRELVDERAARYGAQASTIGEHRRLAGEPEEPRILLLVDGIGAFREAYEYSGASSVFAAFSQIATDGRKVGVHVVVTGDRPGSVPTSLGSTIQKRLVLRLASVDDYALVGAPKDVLSPTSPPGRGLLDGDEIQVAVLGGVANVAIQGRRIEALAATMRRQGIAEAPPVERLPTSIALVELPATGHRGVSIGVADEDLQPTGIEPRGAFMIAGPPGSGRTTALSTVGAALRRSGRVREVVLFSPHSGGAASRRTWSSSAIGAARVAAEAERFVSILAGEDTPPGTLALLIENLAEFTGTEAEDPLVRLVRAAVRAEQFVVGESESSTWSSAYLLGGPFKAAKRGLLVSPGELDGDSLLGTSLGRVNRADLPPGRGFLVSSGRAAKLQVAVDEG